MSLEDQLFEQRYRKIQEIEALGFAPYPRKFAYSHTIADIVSGFSDASGEQLEADRVAVRACGRLVTIRRQGKAGFCHISQGGASLQVYVRKDEVPDESFELYKSLDAGDMIGVDGYLFRTKTNELTIRAEKLEFLAKAILPMPEKWHGLQDVEIRYRQRYLDMIANPDVRRVFVQRNKVISALRRSLEQRGYIEVETPMMQPIHGGALARPFQTHHNALDVDLFLRIAPELYLKRLIVGGFDRVYEINRNFRNEGISKHHNPEFTMLEFYQAYSDYKDLMDFSAELLREVAAAVHDGSTEVEYGGHKIDFAKLHRVTMKEALVEFWPDGETRPALADLDDLARVREVVEAYNGKLAASHPEGAEGEGPRLISLPSGSSVGAALLAIFEQACESRLIQPTLVYDYPVEASPLSKNKPGDPNWVERFEIYVAGMEVANAYSELNDPQEQRRRFLAQVERRGAGDREAHVMDEDYLRALCYGMPPTAGEGIGIDRLTMVLTNSRSIRDVILFPLLRPEGELGIARRLASLDNQHGV
ncbi:MAG: lysine--tRNA ligase [Bryobacterales bacterium]